MLNLDRDPNLVEINKVPEPKSRGANLVLEIFGF